MAPFSSTREILDRNVKGPTGISTPNAKYLRLEVAAVQKDSYLGGVLSVRNSEIPTTDFCFRHSSVLYVWISSPG